MLKDLFVRPYSVSALFITIILLSASFTVSASENAARATSTAASQSAEQPLMPRIFKYISALFPASKSTASASERKALYDAGFQKCQSLQFSSAGRSAPSSAINCYRSEAEEGNPKAQLKMGFAYHAGIGVEKNLVLAYVWHSIAWSRDGRIGRRHIERVSDELRVEEMEEAKNSYKDLQRIRI